MHCPTSLALLALAVVVMAIASAADAHGLKRAAGASLPGLWAWAFFLLGLSGWVLARRAMCGAPRKNVA